MIKRLILLQKLNHICRSRGFELYGTRRLWFFAIKMQTDCDFHLVTARYVYSVKLFSVLKRKHTLVFFSNGTYAIRHFMSFISNIGLALRLPYDSKPKPFPRYNFRAKFNSDWELKIPRRILLVHPSCHEIKHIPHNGRETTLGYGSSVMGCDIYSLQHFIGLLEVTE